MQRLSPEVDVGHLRHEDADVPVALEDRSQWIGDLARRERASRHLIGEGLEEVEVPSVYERDVDRCSAKLHRRLESAEASADDDDPVASTVIIDSILGASR